MCRTGAGTPRLRGRLGRGRGAPRALPATGRLCRARAEPELSGDRPEARVQGPVGGCCRVRALKRDAVAAGEGDVVAAQRAEPLDVNVVEHMTARREVVQGALVSSARRAASDHARGSKGSSAGRVNRPVGTRRHVALERGFRDRAPGGRSFVRSPRIASELAARRFPRAAGCSEAGVTWPRRSSNQQPCRRAGLLVAADRAEQLVGPGLEIRLDARRAAFADGSRRSPRPPRRERRSREGWSTDCASRFGRGPRPRAPHCARTAANRLRQHRFAASCAVCRRHRTRRD
jgi:hypothetical protein